MATLSRLISTGKNAEKKIMKVKELYYFRGGEVAEWSIAAVLKTVGCKSPGGSNPSLSAKENCLKCSGIFVL